MEDLKGYQIQKEAVFENGRGFALAHNPEAQSPFGIWHFTIMPERERNYYGFTACRGILPPEKEFEKFLSAYDYVYKVPQLAEGQRPLETDYYRYYTHYPLDTNTFPNSKELGLLEIAPYDNRTWVEGNSIRTWGELIYTKPLPEKLVEDYKLKPSRLNPDISRKIMGLEAERKEKRSITAQLRKEAKQGNENREPSTKKSGPSHEDR